MTLFSEHFIEAFCFQKATAICSTSTDTVSVFFFFFNCFHTVLLSFQTLMEDGKRETAVSMLPMVPEDSDSGRTYTCRVLNPAAPAGRQTSVTINVQREHYLFILISLVCDAECGAYFNFF